MVFVLLFVAVTMAVTMPSAIAQPAMPGMVRVTHARWPRTVMQRAFSILPQLLSLHIR